MDKNRLDKMFDWWLESLQEATEWVSANTNDMSEDSREQMMLDTAKTIHKKKKEQNK